LNKKYYALRKYNLKPRSVFANVGRRVAGLTPLAVGIYEGKGQPIHARQTGERSSPVRVAKAEAVRPLSFACIPRARRAGDDQPVGAICADMAKMGAVMNYDLEAARLKKDWAENPRWKGIERAY